MPAHALAGVPHELLSWSDAAVSLFTASFCLQFYANTTNICPHVLAHMHLPTCLQEYLTCCCQGQTLLLVSHDRAFLNAACQETVELKDQQLR
jgi:hypothetical protein